MRLDLDRPDRLVGLRLGGRFEVVRVLGVGGMGVVVEARHRGLGQHVAIKLLKQSVRAEARARFRREASIAARLSGDRVARVTDADVFDDGTPYMVLELVRGGSVADELSGDHALPVETAVSWVMDACEALAEAHARGVVHRDLKPSNLLLAGDGEHRYVKVSDFGVAKDEEEDDELTHADASIGSPSYMSPEQIDDPRAVDGRSDLFALGVVLFELLCKTRPFDARGISGTLTRVTSHPPPDLAALRTGVPAGLVTVVERALEKRREDRYQTAYELAAALAPFAGDGGVEGARRVARAAVRGAEAGQPSSLPASWRHRDPSTLSDAGGFGSRTMAAAPGSRGRTFAAWVVAAACVAVLAAWALSARPWRTAAPAASPVVPPSSASAAPSAAPPG